MIGIVVLNYMNWQDTRDLILSIKKQSYKNYAIVVIDNCSPNDSFEKMNSLYFNEKKITVIKSEKNLGYAKGNNLGISYLRKKFKLSNIIVLNADTLMIENNYIEELMKLKYNSDIAVIGTKIIGSDGINQNPVYTKVGIKSSIRTYIRLKFARFFDPIKKLIYINKEKTDIKDCFIKKEFYLHGSALFFTPNYFEKFSGFYPDTFLYFEEDILAIILKKCKLKFKYYDKLAIYHKEGQSSNLSWNNSNKIKYKLITKSIVKSFKVIFSSKNEIYKMMNSNR